MATILKSPIVWDFNAHWKDLKRGENFAHYEKCWGKKQAELHFRFANSWLAFDYENNIIQDQLKRFGKILIGCPICEHGFVQFDRSCVNEDSFTDNFFRIVECEKCKKEFAVTVMYGEFI